MPTTSIPSFCVKLRAEPQGLVSLWTSVNARPFSLLEPIDKRHQVFNLRRALKLRSHEQLPTVDRTLHFDRLFSLRQRRKKTREMTAKHMKTRQFSLAVFFGKGGRGALPDSCYR